ncbi:MAG TPA: diacylglycerol kinase family protein [Thermoanaerobaculia bacterium]|nr:diacylglycerol kinase family protein [Thermoanaerobaculia bacterium]
MKGTLFLNRNSGPKADAVALVDAARAAGLEIVELSEQIDCLQEVRSRLARGLRLFIAAGGDGTVHHVVQALVHTEGVLAVIPNGTYNHFARDLEIPPTWEAALDVALNGDTHSVDAGRVNDRFFVNNVSLGLYPEMVARREARGRDYPRWKARIYAFYGTLRKYRHVTLAVESEGRSELIRTHVFMMSNNSYDMERFGIEAPRETLTGGALSVYWLPHTSRLRLTRYIARYLAGRVRTIPGFRSFRTAHLRVQTTRTELRVGIDGELFTLAAPLTVSIVPQSLSVRVPRPSAAQEG